MASRTGINPLDWKYQELDISKDKFPFDDNSVTDVIAHHVFEHIGDGFFDLVKELYRVCEDGAIIDVEIPHHRHDDMYGDPSHCRFFTLDTFKMFSKKYNEWHIKAFNSLTGFGLKLNVDLEPIDYEYQYDPRAIKMLEKMDQEQRQFFIDTSFNIVRVLKVKWQVNK
jgi:ubiquinone/menaquinone biosynthesis C-methylase UbiE